jgi:hypothetical protein
VVSESWNATHNQLSLDVSGNPARHYDLAVWNPTQITSVEGATLTNAGQLQIEFSGEANDTYVRQKVVIHFARP